MTKFCTITQPNVELLECTGLCVTVLKTACSVSVGFGIEL